MGIEFIKHKCQRAVELLQEYDVDMWLVVARESKSVPDPVLFQIYGTDVMWITAFVFTKKGDVNVICGYVDELLFKNIGAYDRVVPYHDDFGKELLAMVKEYDPKNIAINYSMHDELSDGLSLGLYKMLEQIFDGTDYFNRLISAQKIVASLRGRKLPEEVEKMKVSAHIAETILEEAFHFIHPGTTDGEVMDFIRSREEFYEVVPSWDPDSCPTMNIGAASAGGGHVGVANRVIQPGDLIRFDYGVTKDGYASDIQRLGYVLRPGETKVPEPVEKAFNMVWHTINMALEMMVPGELGLHVDEVTRKYVIESGYREYRYGLGHQIGMFAHDGGGNLGPAYPRYGDRPFQPIEIWQTYCVEPAVPVEGYGYLGVEEEVQVTDHGVEFITHPHKAIYLIPAE